MSSRNDKTEAAIIGGGASGLACAIMLKRLRPDISVTVYEKLSNIGKKILATGNGRCNLSNTYIATDCYNGDNKIIDLILNNFGTEACLKFFSSMGLLITSEDGRIYPMSMHSSSVLQALKAECDHLNVVFRTDCQVKSIRIIGDANADSGMSNGTNSIDNRFLINDTFYSDICILALGGKAAAMHGTDGEGYKLLRSLGIRYEPIHPALTQIRTDDDTEIVKRLKGIRVRGTLTLLDACGCALQKDSGEILFTDYGVSGIPSMQISGVAAQLCTLSSNQADQSDKSEKTAAKPVMKIDLCPALRESELLEYICERIRTNPNLAVDQLLSGIMNITLASVITDVALDKNVLSGRFKKQIAENQSTKCQSGKCQGSDTAGKDFCKEIPASMLKEDDIQKIARTVKEFTLTVTGTNGYKDAQVTGGGVGSDELKPDSLQSKSVPGLFICGELLNADGLCGGYNLHFAWGSGIQAAKEVAALC